MNDLNEIIETIQNGKMTPDTMLETMRELSREDRSALTARMFEEVDISVTINLLPQVETSIMHEGAGIQVSIDPIDGGIIINSGGNPYTGDPIVGDNIEYSPADNSIYHTNGMVVEAGREAVIREGHESRYDVDLSPNNTNPALTASDTSVPNTTNTSSEVGISTITSENGLLEVTVYDRGRISQGAVTVQYTDPDNGNVTILSADENTATVSQINADGTVLKSGAIEMGSSYMPNDFRHVPAPLPGPGGQ